jgi:hypothetical protein
MGSYCLSIYKVIEDWEFIIAVIDPLDVFTMGSLGEL